MAHPVNWFQIFTGGDGKALAAFYKKVFGWKTSPSPDGSMEMIAPEADGIPGGIGKSQDGKAGVAVYVSVEDIDTHLKKIAKAGGKGVMPKMPLPGNMGFIAGFLDPAGNWTGLWQPPAKAPAKKAAPAKKPAAKKAAPAKKVPAKKAPEKKAAKKKR